MSPTGPGAGGSGEVPPLRIGDVEAFTAELARAVDEHAVGGVLGETGRRVAVLVDQVMRMHLPGSAGACPECRLPAGRAACGTWRVIADVLAGWEPEQVRAEYARLRARYPATIAAVDAANDRVHVMVRAVLGPDDDPPPGSAGEQWVSRTRGGLASGLALIDEPLRLAREQVIYPTGVEPGRLPWPVLVIMPSAARGVVIGGQRYAVREPARRNLSVPAERSPLTLTLAQIHDVSGDMAGEDDPGWALLLMLPRDVTEFGVITAHAGSTPPGGPGEIERTFPVQRPPRGSPVG
jgi:hypothetical protein